MRTILHVDMDAFFAAIEQKRRPELEGRPVVVGGSGDPNTRGVVATCNYEARKYGIRSAMPLKEAYRRCPEAVFLPVDYREYQRVSERLMEVLTEFSDTIESVGLDEAFLDITDSPTGLPEEIGRRLKSRIRERLGLTGSVGIGPNKLVAKIASDMEKPDGLTIIKPGEERERLAPLPVRSVWGVGRVTEGHLKRLGINTLGQLASAPDEILKEHFGENWGIGLKMRAQGIDDSPVVTGWEPKSLSREETFEKDTSNILEIKKELEWMADDLKERLAERGYKARTVTVKLRFKDFTTLTRAKTLDEPTDDSEKILKAGLGVLHRFPWKQPVRLVGLRVSNFEKEEGD